MHAVRPYVQLLNTSAWTLYDCDVDPDSSHPELLAYLLVLGDRMATSGEVATAALHAAAWWFERGVDEVGAFTAAASRSERPDADALRAVAGATVWLRELRHETLEPPAMAAGHRPIPGTGLLVPRALEAEPPRLAAEWARIAERAVAAFHAHWQAEDASAIRGLCDWLVGAVPSLLVTARGSRIVWDPARPTQIGGLRHELRQAAGVAVRDLHQDLLVIDRHTRSFHDALVDPAALAAPDPATEQSGYTYMHRERALVTYNLHEAGMERLRGPELPYARAMLGARTVHEWAHLAVAAGWVPPVAPPERIAELTRAFATQMDGVIAAAPPALRRATAEDLAALAAAAAEKRDRATSPGAALAEVLQTRLPDFQANLVARRFLNQAEQETYVRQNVRTLRSEYPRPQLWRMLVRYLYEYQYLRFSGVADPRGYFLGSTWFAEDFLATGVLDDERFDALVRTVALLCECYAVDESRFRRASTADAAAVVSAAPTGKR